MNYVDYVRGMSNEELWAELKSVKHLIADTYRTHRYAYREAYEYRLACCGCALYDRGLVTQQVALLIVS